MIVQLTAKELKEIVAEASQKAISEAFKTLQPSEEPEAGKTDAKFLTKKQAAKALNCSPSTLDNFRRAGKLNAYFLGKTVRFKVEEIQNLAKPK